MFLKKYVDDVYFKLILSKYDENYLEALNEKDFLKVYYLLKKLNFYFIEDIILNYLEIFELSVDDVLKKIKILKEKLGANYVFCIGNNLSYLEEILKDEGDF